MCISAFEDQCHAIAMSAVAIEMMAGIATDLIYLLSSINALFEASLSRDSGMLNLWSCKKLYLSTY